MVVDTSLNSRAILFQAMKLQEVSSETSIDFRGPPERKEAAALESAVPAMCNSNLSSSRKLRASSAV